MSKREFIRKYRAEIDQTIRARGSRQATINDRDREEWLANDEGLYRWARREGVRL